MANSSASRVDGASATVPEKTDGGRAATWPSVPSEVLPPLSSRILGGAGPVEMEAPLLQNTTSSTSHSAESNGAVKVPPSKTPAGGATTSASPHQRPNTRESPPLLVTGSASTSVTGGGSSSTGCVRWCMNIALQSFVGEPWAIHLQPAADDVFTINGSFHSTNSPTDVVNLNPTTTTASTYNNQAIQSASVAPSGNTSASNRSSPVQSGVFGGGEATRFTPSMLRSGLQLAIVDYNESHASSSDNEVLSARMFGYDPQGEEAMGLQQCVAAINSPPVTYGSDDLLSRITNVEFIGERGSPEDAVAGVPMHYRLSSSLEPMLNSTLNPAITAVVDHCVNAMVLVYGATQEMKQMGLIGTPEECGLLPHGIRLMMERYLERKEQQSLKVTSPSSASSSTTTRTSAGAGASVTASPPLRPTPPLDGSCTANSAEEMSDGDHPDGIHRSSAAATGYNTFIFPSIGSRSHRFARIEATFIAFDSTSVVDLLDLSNKRVELVLRLAPPPTPSAFEEKADDVKSTTSSSSTTDSFVLNARQMPVEHTHDALSALDIGLGNLSRALELSLLQSESGSSLLFSLTTFTDSCRCATMHILCLAEDPAAQTWLASTVQARSQAIPLGEEQSWASIQNTPMPSPLHHHAATMLVPALCFGNMFTSVLICVYNSITAVGRLNRDLTFAVTGYRMRTIPRVTMASSRRGLKKLPADWEEYFTNDGRRYFMEKTTQTITWEDPQLTSQQRSSRSGGSASSGSSNGSNTHHRPSRIGLGSGDKDFLALKLQQELHHSTTAAPSSPSRRQIPQEERVDIGIVVVDTKCRPRVVLDAHNPQFAQQYAEEEATLRGKQLELEEAAAELQRLADEAASAAAAAASSTSSRATTSNAEPPSKAVANTIITETPVTQVPCGIRMDSDDDEEISTLCRSTTTSVDDFILDDYDLPAAKAQVSTQRTTADHGTAAAADAISGAVSSSVNDALASDDPGTTDGNAESQFYFNVMQEQATGGGDSCTSGASSARNSPLLKHSAAPNDPSVPAVSEGSSNASESGSTAVASLPPEMQELESLVEEFSEFYKKSYETERRVQFLEAQLAQLQKEQQLSSAASPAPASVSSARVSGGANPSTVAAPAPFPEDDEWSHLLHKVSSSIDASPSARLRAALHPLLRSRSAIAMEGGAAKTESTSSIVLRVLQEALRLAEMS